LNIHFLAITTTTMGSFDHSISQYHFVITFSFTTLKYADLCDAMLRIIIKFIIRVVAMIHLIIVVKFIAIITVIVFLIITM